ncbi:MAG TPA: cupin domain-containing protein [Solirubrobacteraceae bacterium]|nr:cupin domain-containing protein [Solirubrobacteraceae bacterium]
MPPRAPIVRAAGLKPTDGDPGRFEGAVRFARIPPGEREDIDVAVVSFVDGARTHWHSHGVEQILHALEGAGFLAFQDRVLPFSVGEVARIPAGVLHAHGALAGRALTHLSVTVGGTQWPDPPQRVPLVRDRDLSGR